MSGQGLKIEEKDGMFYLVGVLDEYVDFSPLLSENPPLKLNLKQLERLNSIGVRNLLKFLNQWGDKPLEYHECPSEFIDQVNMIPALLGAKHHGKVASLYAPYECSSCDNEEEVFGRPEDFGDAAEGGEPPSRPCSKCGQDMHILMDSFFVFLQR